MTKLYLFTILLIPLSVLGQELSSVKNIDSIILLIDNDNTTFKKISDTVSYEKEDGGKNWDSSFRHKEFFYKNGQRVKAIAWTKYGNWGQNIIAYYQNSKTIKFIKGESFKDKSDFGSLEFAIYYDQDKDIKIQWLSPKPDNVLGVSADMFLQWSYQLQQKAR